MVAALVGSGGGRVGSAGGKVGSAASLGQSLSGSGVASGGALGSGLLLWSQVLSGSGLDLAGGLGSGVVASGQTVTGASADFSVGLGAGLVTGGEFAQSLSGSALASAGAVGSGATPMTLFGQALEVRDYEGVGLVSTPAELGEVRVGHYPPYLTGINFVIPSWTPKPGTGYLLFLFTQTYTLLAEVVEGNIVGNGMTWVRAGAFSAGSPPYWMGVFWSAALPGFAGPITVTPAYDFWDAHWLLLEAVGADVGVAGEALVAAGPDVLSDSASVGMFFARTPLRPSNIPVQFMRADSAITHAPAEGQSASTQQTGWIGNRTRALWKAGNLYLVGTSAGVPSVGSPNMLMSLEVSVSPSATPIWLSGVRVGTQIAFGSGTVSLPSTRIGSGLLEFPVDSGVVLGSGFVSAGRLSGVGLDLSSAPGGGGFLVFGKLRTFAAAGSVVADLVTSPVGGNVRTMHAHVNAVTHFSRTRQGLGSMTSLVHAHTVFGVRKRPKRAIADIRVFAVTGAAVSVAPLRATSVLVFPLRSVAIRVVRDEDELMTERDEFDIGDVARVLATVTMLGVLVDPLTVMFQWKAPDGSLTTGNAVRTGPGVYYGDIPCQQPGRHWWRISGSEDASFGEEGAIRVRRSAVLDT